MKEMNYEINKPLIYYKNYERNEYGNMTENKKDFYLDFLISKDLSGGDTNKILKDGEAVIWKPGERSLWEEETIRLNAERATCV